MQSRRNLLKSRNFNHPSIAIIERIGYFISLRLNTVITDIMCIECSHKY